MEMPPGFAGKMHVDDAASEVSSSSISSPPVSPQNNGLSDTIRVSRPSYSNPGLSGGGVVANATSATSAKQTIAANNAAHATNGNVSTSASTTNANGSAPEKPKRQRKKKEVGADGKPVTNDKDKPKEKKPRKPREPKDRTTTPISAAPRKKQKIEKTEEKTVASQDAPAPTQSRQPTITEFGTFSAPPPPASASIPQHQHQHRTSDGIMRSSLPPPTSNPSTPRPFSSGQNYDPIRGSTMEAAQRPSQPANGPQPVQGSPHVKRASASPSIASLIDPPTVMKTSVQPSSYSPQTAMQQPFVLPQQHSPPLLKATTSTFAPPPPGSPSVGIAQPVISNMDGAMDVDPTCEVSKPPPEIKAPSKSSSSAPTPKIAQTKSSNPKGTGSGLLSSSDLFGGPGANETAERKGVNIELRIPLNPKGGNTINIAQEIVKKYGRDAINPRAAAHREQLLRVAAQQSKLEGGLSNDDMSVDLMSELEGDSNVEMGGMDDEKSNTGVDGEAKPRKRRKKVEEYDKEDDFIDDTELAWQEQAAVAKDGFFVYSGPLVPAGQEPQVESAASTRGSRGRGRGRGRGTTTTGTTHASLAEKKTTDSSASNRSRGRGRGTGAPRKPRITKADRERMEAEKMDRERTAAHLGGPTAAPVPLAPTPTPGLVSAAPPAMQQQQQQQGYAAQPLGSMV